MTKTQALAEARIRWGRHARVEDNGKRFRDGTERPTPEQRVAMQHELAEHRCYKPARPDLATFGDERTVAEYRQALAAWDAEYRAWEETDSRLSGTLLASRRYQVGDHMQILGAFHVRGEGDTWEEAFAKADESRAHHASLAAATRANAK